MTIQISSASSLSNSTQLVDTAFILNYISFSIFALGVYEYIITIPKEAAYIWRRRFTPVSALLLLLRYGTLAYGGIAIGSSLVTTDKMCTIMGRLSSSMNLLSMTVVCVASAVRVYALSLYRPYQGAQLRSIDSSAVLVARLSTALVDLIVIIVTLRAKMSSYRVARCFNIRVPIMTALLRDGTLYFFVAFVMNMAHVLLYETLHELYMICFIYIVTPILLSRLFLNLREIADSTGIDPDMVHNSQSPEAILVLANFIRTQAEGEDCEDRDLRIEDSGPTCGC